MAHHPGPDPRYSRRDYIGKDRPFSAIHFDNVAPDRVHGHDYLEVQFVTGGRGSHLHLTGRRHVRRGDVVLLRPGAMHAYTDTARLSVHVLCLASEVLRHELHAVMDDPVLHGLLRGGAGQQGVLGIRFLHLTPAPLRRCNVQLSALARLRHAPWSDTHIEQVGRLLLVLNELAKAAGRDGCQPPDATLHPAVRQAAALLESEPARQWSLTGLARAVCLNESYFCRLFKQHTGVPPLTYLTQRRAERAAALLHTDRTIQQIAIEVGWPEPSYFARRFKATIGVPASVYRERLRLKPPA